MVRVSLVFTPTTTSGLLELITSYNVRIIMMQSISIPTDTNEMMDIAETSDVAVVIAQDDPEAPSISSHDIEGAPSKHRSWRCYALLAIAILSLSIGAAVGVKSSKKESPPTVEQDFTDFDDGYYSYVLGVIVDQAAPSALSLSDPRSPQNLALEWLAFQDTMYLREPSALVQRYALCVLYFATGGVGFWHNEWLLEGVSECEFGGVVCHDGFKDDETELEDETVQQLHLGQRALVGSLPSEIGLLSNLLALDLKNNRLAGGIPEELYRLTNLKEIDLSRNELSMEISNDLHKFTDLVFLSLQDNFFEGSFPDYPPNLEYLLIAGNMFTGHVVDIFRGNNAALVYIDIGFNDFEGSIPAEIGHFTNLKSLGFHNTQVGGNLPSELGLLDLEELSISSSLLTGTLPKELSECTSLIILAASNLPIEGPIPTEIGLLSNLQILSLVATQMEGTLPSEMGLLTSLNWLQLSNTDFTGTLPTELANLSKLSAIWIHWTKLEGTVPEGICGLPAASMEFIASCINNRPLECECCTSCVGV